MNSNINNVTDSYYSSCSDEQLKIFIRNNASSPEVLDQHLERIIEQLTVKIFQGRFSNIQCKCLYELIYEIISLRGYKMVSKLSKFDFEEFVQHLHIIIKRIDSISIFNDWKLLTVDLTIMLHNFQHPLDIIRSLETYGVSKVTFISFIKKLLEYMNYKGPYIKPIVEILFHLFNRTEFEMSFIIEQFIKTENKNDNLYNNYLLLFSKFTISDKFNTKIYKFIKENILLYKEHIDSNVLMNYYKNIFNFVDNKHLNIVNSDKIEIKEYLFNSIERDNITTSYKASRTLVNISLNDKSLLNTIQGYILACLKIDKSINIGFLFLVSECYRRKLSIFGESFDTNEEIILNKIINCSKEENLENRKGRLSVEKYGTKRDCAFFCLWCIFHFTNKSKLKRFKNIKSVIESIVFSCLFDNEIKLRRAASATLQEVIGKVSENTQFIKLLNLVDFHNVSNRKKCIDYTLKEVVKIDYSYFKSIHCNFLIYKRNFISQKDRDHFSKYIGRLFEIESKIELVDDLFVDKFQNDLMGLLKGNRYTDEKETVKLITYLDGVSYAYDFINTKESKNGYMLMLNVLVQEVYKLVVTTPVSKIKYRGGFKRELYRSILNIASLNYRINKKEVNINIKWIEDLFNLNDTNLTKHIISLVLSFFNSERFDLILFESFIKALNTKIKSLERIKSIKLVILYELLAELIFNFILPIDMFNEFFALIIKTLRYSDNIKLKENLTNVVIRSIKFKDKMKHLLTENNITKLIYTLVYNSTVYTTQFGKDTSGELRIISIKLIYLLIEYYSACIRTNLLKECKVSYLHNYTRMVNEPFSNVSIKLKELNIRNIKSQLNLEVKEYEEIESKGALEGIIKSLSIEDSNLTNLHKTLLNNILEKLKESTITEIFNKNKKYKLGIIFVIYYVLSKESVEIKEEIYFEYLKDLLYRIKNTKLKVIVNRNVCKFMVKSGRFKTLFYVDYLKWIEHINIPIIKKEFQELVNL